MPRLAVLFVLSAASLPCPDLNLIHYIILEWAGNQNMVVKKGRLKTGFPVFQTTFHLF
ncbi:hypothetical protein NEIMUCOT_03632 [Neisseria mucosa ATCC 25996]|uniref:Uncharacterized protein n=1 Tax=Neisseria mucosa (strain ATCC 25996 / DSM 4631 / NCTC 10774 / M26) TaxID=546266 RepID=D2ZSQ0_NEIM2|nr:hypothetical protein NEIMUCOT_03632 [Neisseria mucosa ATCC 25996]